MSNLRTYSQNQNIRLTVFAARLSRRPVVDVAPQMVRAGLSIGEALFALRMSTRGAK